MDSQWSLRSRIEVTVATGTTGNLNGDIIDMASNGGFESLLVVAGASVTSTAQHLKLQVGTASDSLSDATGDIQHTVQGLYLDVYRPILRFARGVFTASGASSPGRAIVSIAYGARSQPTTQPAGTTGIRLYSPGTGTATG